VEEKAHAKRTELRREKRSGKGARFKQAGSLRVSAEKLRYQEDDVVENLIGHRVMDWIELEGNRNTEGLLMTPVHPAKLTKLGRAQVYRRLVPGWIKKQLHFLTDKTGVSYPMFEFMFRAFFVKQQDKEERGGSKSSKSSSKGSGKSVVGGAGRGASSVAHPTGDASSSGNAGASSNRAITCKVLEHKRHTVSPDKLSVYLGVGRAVKRGRRRE
jgi:hypothetical protein